MDWLNVFKDDTLAQLHRNWREQEPKKGTPGEIDFMPVCKLFLPWTSGTWLVTELEPDSSLAFGLCDLGVGYPELGVFCVEEIWSVRGPGGLRVEQDIHFRPTKTLSEYATEARKHLGIRA